MRRAPRVIAIDGPAASGKTTVGRMLAEALGYLLLDTGSMYRAVTLAALRDGIAVDDEATIVALSHRIDIVIESSESGLNDGRLYTVMLDGTDVTWDLRTADVDAHVSRVSAYAGVREELVRRQREMAATGNVVMVGRDIGTVVVPDAPLKLYVTASPEERARRRWLERRKRGSKETYEAILADVRRRDGIDSSRAHSPLKAADDAIIIDTTDQSPESVVERILGLCYTPRGAKETQAETGP